MEDKKEENAGALSERPETTEGAPAGGTPPAGEGAITGGDAAGDKPPKGPSGFKKVFKKFNLYLLLFILIVIIAAAVAVVSYINSKKAPPTPSITSQGLDSDSLKQLANSDATVGGSGQTLTVQGNAIFSGQVLIRSDLSVAGTIKVGKEMQVTDFTSSGKANLNDTQINNLQVANGAVFQSSVTLQKDLNVGGNATFSAPVTMGQLTVTKLIMSGNASLQVPNHISFPGASPLRTIDTNVLGAGGSASISGSDTSGTLNINTGGSPAAGCFAAIKFTQAYTSTPHVLISPVGSGAGSLDFYATRTTTGFSVCTNNAAPAGQTFAFDYFVTQ